MLPWFQQFCMRIKSLFFFLLLGCYMKLNIDSVLELNLCTVVCVIFTILHFLFLNFKKMLSIIIDKTTLYYCYRFSANH